MTLFDCLLLMPVSCLAAELPAVTVIDHGLVPAAYPRYLGGGPGLGWQDRYNQDENGRFWMRRDFGFRNVRIPWRVSQTFAGDSSRPVGRPGLRFAQSRRRATSTQPRWLATWGRHDEQFPGLLDVIMDGKGLAGVPVAIVSGNTGSVGHVRFLWDHGPGSVVATFIMLPDDDRLFIEVAITPRQRAEQLVVSLCCWPFGDFRVRTNSQFSSALSYGKPLSLPPADATAMFTDPSFDPGGRESQGTCGLTHLPAETTTVTATRTFPLFLAFNLPLPEKGKTVYLHFVLWELLHRRGGRAWNYLVARERDTLQRFEVLPEIHAPKFAEARKLRLSEARRGMEQVRAKLSQVPSPPRPAEFRRGTQMSKAHLHLQWSRFFCEEAQHALSSEDWRAAAAAVKRVEEHLRCIEAEPW